MGDAFDPYPYHEWLGIPPEEQPPSLYRLLAIRSFEDKANVIEHAADQRMGHLRTFQTGKRSALSQKLLNEVAATKLTLLNPAKKAAYDARLRAAIDAKDESSDSFRREMAELVGDAKLPVARSRRSVLPAVLAIGLLVGVLGLAAWTFLGAGRSERRTPAQPVALTKSQTPTATPVPANKAPKPSPTPEKPAKDIAAPQPPAKPTPLPPPEEEHPQIAQTSPPEPAPTPPPPSPPPSESRLPDSELKRLPVPDAKALEDGLKIARDAYEADYARATTPAARRALAKQILQQGLEQKDDAVARFVLLRLARDIAGQAEDASLASQAVDRLAETFNVDPWAMKAEIITASAKQARKTADHKAVAEQALALMRDALAADASAVAEQMAKLALAEGGRVRDKELVTQARTGQRQAQQAAKALEQVQAARAVLQDAPADPGANLAVGRYECFVKGDWDAGLAHLAKGRDTGLAALAHEDLKAPEEDAARLKLGDAWWDKSKSWGAAFRARRPRRRSRTPSAWSSCSSRRVSS